MYSKLDPSLREIRLLCLQPGSWNDSIICQLKTVSLHDNPCFKALSYVWGNPYQKRQITVNGQSFTTTHNLFMALQRMREKQATLTLWVDAVCINQADLDERCQQVQLMGDIYSSAKEVLVWLGYGGGSQAPREQPKIYQWIGDDTDMELVDAYFEQCQNRKENYDDTEDILGAFVFIRLRVDNKHLHEMPFFDADGERLPARNAWPMVVRALDKLGSAPWWNRIWVVQEIVLARKATVVYNQTTAPWEMLVQAAKSSELHDQFCCEDLLSTRPMEEEETITKLRRVVHEDIETLRFGRSQGTRLSLSQAMSQTFQRDATDIRDKVHGLLGLVTNWYKRAPLLPDYSLSPRETFMRATLSELQGSNSLQGLMGTTRTDVPDIPSWITQDSTSETWRASQKSRINRTDLFRAAGPTVAHVELIGDTLVVDGFEPVDTVACVGLTMFAEKATWKDINVVVKSWRQIAGLENKEGTHAKKQFWEETFWRTMVNDCIGWLPYEEAKQQRHDPSFVRSIFRRLRDTDLHGLPEDWWSWLQSQENGYNARYDDNNSFKHTLDHIRLFQQSFLGATALRKFFITTGGRMGLGSPSMLPGDVIVILLGGDAPFCIRSKLDQASNCKRLIGDVYVHGLMNGEGIPFDWKESSIQITLR